jgi:hypothetical protein
MGISAGIGGAAGGLFNGIASIFAGNAKANAATQAAQIQANSAQQGLNTIQGMLPGQQANQQPFIQAGQTSLANVMTGLSNGTFGAGSTGAAPVYGGGTFTAPTAAQAQATPGYQFAQTQGSKGILEGAAAAGGAISGGTLKSLASYNSGLASTTYQNTFQNALSTYGAGLSQYQAQLQGYGAQLQGQQQQFNQAFAPVGVGEQAASSLNNTETQQGENIANLYNNQGNALAAGVIGSTNQQYGGIQSGIAQIGGMNGQNYNTLGGLLGGYGGVSNGSSVGGGYGGGLGAGAISYGNPVPGVGPGVSAPSIGMPPSVYNNPMAGGGPG